MPLRETLSNAWDHVQGFLVPILREDAGPLTAQHERLVVVLEVAGVEAFVRMWPGLPGRPLKDRHALSRAFVAKAVLGLATTSALIERLSVDRTLRRLCGWERAASVPGESTFSRAFAEFARSGLPGRAHEALMKQTHKDRLVGHISRDATAIEAREKPARSAPAAEMQKRKRGRPKKGEAAPAKEPRRLERQVNMTLTSDAGRSSHGVFGRHEAQRQRSYDELDRLTWAVPSQGNFGSSARVASGKIDQSGSESQDSDTETTTSQTELASEAIFRREFCKSLHRM